MSRPYAIRYLPAAEQDLLDILDYIARDDPRAARGFVNRVERAVGRLNYLVFYVVVRRSVQIRRLIHGARRYEFLLRGH